MQAGYFDLIGCNLSLQLFPKDTSILKTEHKQEWSFSTTPSLPAPVRVLLIFPSRASAMRGIKRDYGVQIEALVVIIRKA
ncbi:hypothetical protein AAFF_G00128200 [Aldrovandia affinis]|uniref:Uncharacterized protein n=1 Tax=Aldrovandia affinis TaxID=143900 RepID=A0AAD7WY40_9TELE|nr:hypothetical protein AAFF_G00128200 [Aldrovandia affinis]